ncbi:MAG: hypothetical protein MUD01_03240 [Chloroflexaceae bacterium]|jgi:hypothetical protein|nr:hypothetical protein [Chloroflexaceae bacterium]
MGSLHWLALQELERARANQEQPRRLPYLRAGKSEPEMMRLIFQDVQAIADTLQPAAYVFTDAHLLNKQTLRLILDELRSPQHFGRPRIAQSAIILCGRPEEKYRTLLGTFPQTRTVLNQAVTFPSMERDTAEFLHVIIFLMLHNLHAHFGQDVDRKACIVDFHAWTQGNWWLLDQLVQLLDRGLGPRRADDAPRVLTNSVLTYVRNVWLERQRAILPPPEEGNAT